MLGIGLETARDLTGDHDVPQPKPSGNHERSKHREHEDLAGPASHAAAESDAHGLCTTIVEQSSRLDPGLAGHGRAGTMPAAFGIIPVFILNGAGVTNRGNNQRSTAGARGDRRELAELTGRQPRTTAATILAGQQPTPRLRLRATVTTSPAQAQITERDHHSRELPAGVLDHWQRFSRRPWRRLASWSRSVRTGVSSMFARMSSRSARGRWCVSLTGAGGCAPCSGGGRIRADGRATFGGESPGGPLKGGSSTTLRR